MSPETQAVLDKANDSLRAARLLLSQDLVDFAASRAYYAMFYGAEALLFSKGLAFSKHSAVVAAFGKEFAKTGLVPAEFHRYLADAEDDRIVGDYSYKEHISAEAAAEHIEHAARFIEIATTLLAS